MARGSSTKGTESTGKSRKGKGKAKGEGEGDGQPRASRAARPGLLDRLTGLVLLLFLAAWATPHLLPG